MPEETPSPRSPHAGIARWPASQSFRFESVFPALTRVHIDPPLTAQSVESVTASGKPLLMRFSGGQVLRTHMRMNGSWHIYRPGEPWQRPRRDMRIVRRDRRLRRRRLQHPGRGVHRRIEPRMARGAAAGLGPDLLSETFDAGEALRRMKERPAQLIADVLLNQRVMAGIGNVYKSEVLFSCGINPFTPVAGLSDDRLTCLIATGRKVPARQRAHVAGADDDICRLPAKHDGDATMRASGCGSTAAWVFRAAAAGRSSG
jgi:endonuclease-8